MEKITFFEFCPHCESGHIRARFASYICVRCQTKLPMTLFQYRKVSVKKCGWCKSALKRYKRWPNVYVGPKQVYFCDPVCATKYKESSCSKASCPA